MLFHLQIPELKRINRIEKDAEFHARNSLKIPVKPNSVLLEILNQETKVPKLDAQPSSSSVPTALNGDMHVGVISIDRICKEKTSTDAREFLEYMRRDLLDIQAKTDELSGQSDSETEPSDPGVRKFLECSGTNWGLTWWVLLALGVIIVISVPLYLLFRS